MAKKTILKKSINLIIENFFKLRLNKLIFAREFLILKNSNILLLLELLVFFNK